jgi:hypothetical protein
METTTALTPIQVMQTSEAWRALTPRLKRWLVYYIVHERNAVEATMATAKCKSELNAKLQSYKTRKHKNIKLCLDMLDEKSDRDIIVEGLRESVRHATPGSIASLRGYALLARLLLADKPPASESDDDWGSEQKKQKSRKQKFEVGQIVLQNGVKFRITALSADGKIEAATEVEDAV